MAEIATGHVNDRPFVRTVYTIAAKRFGGDLVLTQAGQSYRVAWHRGLVVGADIPGADGALLDRAARVFALDDAAFALDDQSAVASRPDDQPVDARQLIFHAVATHYDDARLEQELQLLRGRAVTLAGKGDVSAAVYGFPDGGAQVVSLLGERAWSVDELVAAADTCDPHTTRAIVYALLATDALTIARAQAPAAAKSATARLPPRTTGRMPAAAATPAAPAAPERAKRTTEAGELRNALEDRLALIADGGDHFALLGVDRASSSNQIRTAYFELARRLHPDRVRTMHPDLALAAQQLFARINEAFGVIGDDAKRRAYLAELDAAADSGTTAAQQEEQMRRIFEAEEQFQLGEMALRRQQWREAMTHFESAAELNPEEAEHHAMAAWARWCAHEDKAPIERAVKKGLQKAIAMSPNNYRAYFYRGLIAKHVGDDDGAIAAFEQVLRLEPNHEPTHLELRLLDKRLAEQGKKSSLLDKLKRR